MAAMSAEDEDALRWAGDEPVAPVRRKAPAAPVPEAAPGPADPVPDASDRPGDPEPGPSEPDPEPETAAPPLSSVMLVVLGVLGGVYLILTIGWIVLVVGAGEVNLSHLDGVMFRVAQLLAIAAPAVWFGSALLLNRGRRPLVTVGHLLLGLVVTLPWPLLITGA